MDSQALREMFQRDFYYILAAGIAIGFLVGLVPLILGVRRKRLGWGIFGLGLCTALGAASPVLSIIASVIISILLMRRAVEKATTHAGTDSVE